MNNTMRLAPRVALAAAIVVMAACQDGTGTTQPFQSAPLFASGTGGAAGLDCTRMPQLPIGRCIEIGTEIQTARTLIAELAAAKQVSKGNANALDEKLDLALRKFNHGQKGVAKQQLDLFMTLAESLAARRDLPAGVAAQLVKGANNAAAWLALSETVLYSNLRPDRVIDATNGWLVVYPHDPSDPSQFGSAVAFQFTAHAAFSLSSVDLVLSSPAAFGPNATLAIYADAGGTPGAVLATAAVTALVTQGADFVAPSGVVSVGLGAGLQLDDGTAYWVAVHPAAETGTVVAWWFADPGGRAAGRIAFGTANVLPPGVWSDGGLLSEGGYQLNGTYR
jgi:hypothetical protein